jgi:EAL domain-containing protein (putative c-di-GMP-specific phosphodiesterase class I)
MNLRLDERVALERALRGALERKEFFIEYQPQAELSSCRIVGAEALLRWQHPERGLISPAQFISLAEETGLIIPIGEWVLHTACMQNKAWLDAGLQPIRISVNLSALQFRQKDMVDLVRKTLAATGLPPQYLELEITESMLIHDAEAVIAVVRDLHSMGVHLALDDFGTGYSSLSYLKRFRVHRLKIDQSFVRDINIDPDDAAISAAVISLGHALNMTVIAEGVETSDQSTFLAALGCDEVQGYYFGRPMAAADFARLLAVGVVTGSKS